MINTLVIKSFNGKTVGLISLVGGKMVGSTKSVQEMADSWAATYNGDVDKLFTSMDGWSNGYLTAKGSAVPVIGYLNSKAKRS